MNYDEDYFERGAESGKSLYSNYRWMPELTIPLAHEIMKVTGIDEGDDVLDFGCAKGYLVKALRLLHVNAEGWDTSEYAISHAPRGVEEYLWLMKDDGSNKPYCKRIYRDCHFDCVIAKDVLEHMTVNELDEFLVWCGFNARKLFVVVPLGLDSNYVIPAYDKDVTHQIREELSWWAGKVGKYYGKVEASYSMGHIKENWIKVNRKGNGFILASG